MLVTIPADYEQKRIVPICINDTDDRGRTVFPGWIDAVRPIAGRLRTLVRTITGDVWHVSEVTEHSVHRLSARHGSDLGVDPAGAIYVHAHYKARDLAAGSRRLRTGLDVELRQQMLACLRDPNDLLAAYQSKDLVEKLERRLQELGLCDLQLMLKLYLSESEDKIPQLFAANGRRERNRLSHRFHRALQTALRLL